MVLRFASGRGVRTQHHVSISRVFSSARTVLFRVNSVECTAALIGNTIRNPRSQSSQTLHGSSGKDLSRLVTLILSCIQTDIKRLNALVPVHVSFLNLLRVFPDASLDGVCQSDGGTHRIVGRPSMRYLLYRGLSPQRLRIVGWFNWILMEGN